MPKRTNEQKSVGSAGCPLALAHQSQSVNSEVFDKWLPSSPIRRLNLLTLEQRERHGEEERPGADLALRKAAAAGVRVQVVAEAGHEVEIERGWHDDGDDRDEEEEAEAERLDVLK